jgi:colanic acid biosynthesis glycosyl transferase WcaI
MSASVVALTARALKSASWLHIQDFEVDAAFDLGILSNQRLRASMLSVERRILCAFDRVSTIAPQMVKRLAEKGVNVGKIREVRNWTDTNEVAPGDRPNGFRQELGLKDGDVIVLYAGTMSYKQGLDLIIEAARDVGQTHSNVHFVLSGQGPHKSKLRDMAANLVNVHFLEIQADKRFSQLLVTADLHVVPQRAEVADLVLPSKLGGIFSSGRPLITMAIPGTGLAEEVADVGVIVLPGNVEALAAAVRQLVEDPDLRNALGAKARRRALERWDKNKILTSLMNEVTEACDLKSRVVAWSHK